ncbi:MAG: SDR family oxidoreductase [Deltaproteobacteria bacterium]|nr:SDR family oxidoreductase [Deltaproteobacteria bacterium]
MNFGLKGKVVVITGAGQGVGREIAKVMAAEGAKVVPNDLYQERAEAVAKEITDAGGTAMGIKANIINLDEVKAMMAKTVETFGPVDILVNNAGVPDPIRRGEVARTLFINSGPSDCKFQIDLNIYGWLNCVHAVIGSMVERRTGKILSVISEAGRIGEYNLMVYSGVKAGVLGFTKALAQEVGRYRINLNCIALGATAHEGTKPFLNPDHTPETNEILKKMLKNYPIGRGLGRVGRPSDAAAAIAFLASNQAVFITGQGLSVSGGVSMIG